MGTQARTSNVVDLHEPQTCGGTLNPKRNVLKPGLRKFRACAVAVLNGFVLQNLDSTIDLNIIGTLRGVGGAGY